MNLKFKTIAVGLGVACLLASSMRTQAFALLGPVQPWMQTTNGAIYSYDIGGPMDLTNEYRWNVPVVTYGFDKSFRDFFGTNGVAAVEGAIKILNDLPPGSQIVLTNYAMDSGHINFTAQSQSLYDLKSQTLSLLVEQLGLASPTRNIFVLKQWTTAFISTPYQPDWSPWAIPDYIVKRNFDPQTLSTSTYVNQTLYSSYVYSQPGYGNAMSIFCVDPLASINSAVADNGLNSGIYYTGLTFDDVGGLAYLLSTNNVNYETVLPGVQSVGANPNAFVNGAWRPGVDKITFVPHPVSLLTGIFQPYTNQYTDTYITNGNAVHQQLRRIIARPDFLFSAGYDSFRTGTTNWVNNAALNNNPTGAGPGVIQPSVVITLQNTGRFFYNFSSASGWSEDLVQDVSYAGGMLGSFDGSTNVPIAYPVPQTGNVSMTVRMWLRHSFNSTAPLDDASKIFQTFEWSPTGRAGTVYALQTSTNLSTWSTLFAVTNNGSVCTYQNVNANSVSRFYRLVPQ